MSGGWTARRFWTEARVEPAGEGFTVRLDARAVRTPAKAALVVPTRAMAEAIAAEWAAQQRAVDPRTMPVTRAANAAIDKVIPQKDEVAALIAAYGGADLLCYRAEGPEALAARQAAAWNPMLDWAEAALGARLSVTRGVVPVLQQPAALAALGGRVAALSAFELTALSDLVALTGSLVLGLAAAGGAQTPERAWEMSRIDEDWQAELWGVDEEAAEAAALKRKDFLQAHRFLELARASGG